MKSSNKQNAEDGKKPSKPKKVCLIIWSVSLLTLIITSALQILSAGTVNGVVSPWISLPFIFAGMAFVPSFIIWLVLKLEKRTKALGIISIACLLLFSIDYLLLRLGAGVVQNVMQPYMTIPLILAFLGFVVCFPLWLIIRFKKKVIIPAILLVVGLVVAYLIYENNLSDKRKVACETIHQKAVEFQTNDDNLTQLFTKEQTDTNSAKVYSESLYNKIISDYKDLQKANDDTYNSLKENIDVNKKYMSLFTSWDMSKSNENAQEVHDMLNQAFIAETNYVQAVIDNKPDSELNILLKTANDKWAVTYDISGLEALTTVNNLELVRCNLLFSTPLFNNNLQQQNVFVPYYKK